MRQLNIPNTVQGKVLVVDDEPAIVEVHSRALQRYGIDVLKAYDGEEAWNLFQNNQDSIHVVVTDIDMPRMTGTELIMNIMK